MSASVGALAQAQPAPQASNPRGHNYAEALQKALFFYEAQSCGVLPAENRAEFRGDACLRDGGDVGRDLTGGWFDAGDGVVWNRHDAFGALLLAWSVTRYWPEYERIGQLDRALDNLRHVLGYLERCVDPNSPTGFRIYVGKGIGASGDDVLAPNDHSGAFPPELLDAPRINGGAPASIRASYWVDAATGGSDVAGMLAAAFACSSVAYRTNGETAYAAALLGRARSLVAWGAAHRNTDTRTRRLSNGATIELANYPTRSASGSQDMLLACAWLHRAELAASTPGYTFGYVDQAEFWYAQADVPHGEPWRSFAPGAPDMGAYPILAADSARPAFVTAANDYARFWCYSRSNLTGVPTDITLTPSGFLSRSQGGGWNIPTVLDQAVPLLEWATASANTDSGLKADLITTFTGTRPAGGGLPRQARQIDYVLGENPYRRSFLQGYALPGTDWVRNLHYRTAWFRYGGFATPNSDQPLWNTSTVYGLLAPGPDSHDFYPDVPLTAGTDVTYQEPIVYSGGLLTLLAHRVRQLGSNAGSALPVFPEWTPRPVDYATRSYFVEAFRRTDVTVSNGTRILARIENRANLPPRELQDFGFRVYVTLDGVPLSALNVIGFWPQLDGGETATCTGPFAAGGNLVYFEVRYANAHMGPGEFGNHARRVELALQQTGGTWNTSNDPSLASLATGTASTPNYQLVPAMPVYDFAAAAPTVLGGFEPTPGRIQWRRASIANVSERATQATLIVERVGGRTGPVSVSWSTANGSALAGLDYATAAGVVTWTNGESGEKVVAVSLRDDLVDEHRPFFRVLLSNPLGGATIQGPSEARVFVEDDD